MSEDGSRQTAFDEAHPEDRLALGPKGRQKLRDHIATILRSNAELAEKLAAQAKELEEARKALRNASESASRVFARVDLMSHTEIEKELREIAFEAAAALPPIALATPTDQHNDNCK